MKTNHFSAGTMLLIGVTVVLLGSCYKSYYKAAGAAPASNVASDSILKAQVGKYMILRSGQFSYHMRDIVYTDDHQSVSCYLEPISADHGVHLDAGNAKWNMYRPIKDAAVLNETHVFLEKEVPYPYNEVSVIPYASINKIDVLVHDKSRTNTNTIIVTGIYSLIVGSIVFIYVVGSTGTF